MFRRYSVGGEALADRALECQCRGVNHLEVMDKLGREEHRKDLRHGQQPRIAEPLRLLRSDE